MMLECGDTLTFIRWLAQGAETGQGRANVPLMKILGGEAYCEDHGRKRVLMWLPQKRLWLSDVSG